ncbi:MAG: hypothetical protein MUF58_12125 [Arcicella sp.]|jgi:hypothetical protein|nr:hypothetical protein [Arcicella sp.]
MKNQILLLLLIFTVQVFGQNTSRTHLQDNLTNTFFENIPKGLSGDSLMSFILKNRRKMEVSMPDKFAELFFDNTRFDNSRKYTFDSIPEIATVIINGIEFQSKAVLKKLDNFRITNILKDSLDSAILIKVDSAGLSERKVIERTYRRPYARITQEHPILSKDFFLFKINTLEPIRYRCTSYSPVLDVFNTSDSIGVVQKPRVMIDGRLQAKSFDYDKIDLKNIEKISIFGSADATTYFGQKAKVGLISYITKGSTFCLDWALSNTHVVGEIGDDKGNWKSIVDTVFSNIEQFTEYRKKCLNANGAIYMINGKSETETNNRKTIDMDAITYFRVVSGVKTKVLPLSASNKLVSVVTETKPVDNDTVYIETSRNTWGAKSNFSKIFSELKRLRKTEPEPTPIYIVDNQEITSEKLKEFKSKELEFVESLEGCDAISKYGKRAEYGVVIYRKKKME